MPSTLSAIVAPPPKKSAILILLGIAYLALGVLTLLQIVGAWHFHSTIPWQAVGYGMLNFFIAWGFFSQERWVLSALALNLGGTVVLTLARYALNPPDSMLVPLIVISFNVFMLGIGYLLRRRMRDTSKGRRPGYVFGILWLILFCYTGLKFI